MKTRSKIFLAIGAVVLVFVVLSISILLYYYTHPSKVKSLAEELVSGAYGTSLTIQRMTYSRNPLKVKLEGVHVGPGPEMRGFSLDVPAVEIDFSFDGPWGHRTLVLNKILVSGFTSLISENPDLSGLRGPTAQPSFLGGLMKRLFLYLAFRGLRFQSAEIQGGLVSAQLGEQRFRADHIRGSLEAGRPVELSCEVQVEWPSLGLKLVLPHVSLKTDRKLSLDDPEVSGFIILKGADFESPMASIRDLEVRTALLYHIRQNRLSFSKMKLAPGRVTYKKGVLNKVAPSGLRIAMEGEVDLGDEVLRADSLRITLGDRLQFEGSLDAGYGKQKELGLKIAKATLFPDRLRSLLSPEMELPPVRLTGPISLTGTIEGSLRANGVNAWSWKGDLHTVFKENLLSFIYSGLKGNGNITGEIEAKGTLPDIKMSGKVHAFGMGLSGTDLDLKPFSASFAFSGSYPSYDIVNLSALFPEVRRVYRGKEFKVRNLRLKGHGGSVNAAKRSLYVRSLRLDSSLLKNLEATLNFGPKEGVLKLSGKDTGLLEAVAGLKVLPSGWKVSGQDRIEAEARLVKEKGYFLDGRVVLEGFSFQNRKETCVGEALGVEADVKGRISPSFSGIEGHITVDADRGEILYDRFYFDLKKNPFTCSVEGLYNVTKEQYRVAGLVLGLKSIFRLHMNGELGGNGATRSLDISVKIPSTPLGPVFDTLLKEPFQMEKPILSAMDADGSVSGDFRLKGTGSRWAARGHLLWKAGAVSLGRNRGSLEGIDLSLPVWYRNYDKEDSLEPLAGKLSVQIIKTPFLPDQNLNLNLLAGPNTFSILSSTILKIPGGKVRLGPLSTKGWADMRPSCDTSLSVDSLRLEPLLAKLSTQNIRGILNGNLSSIHIERGIMRSKGQMDARVFGGSVLFSNIGASGLFGSTPVFKLDARWRGLDLAKVTTGTGFGRIQGVLKGHVNRLEITEGQPQRFDLLLETIKKKGFPQRISVKAIDHIAELGGGQSPFVGAAGIFASLFKEFPYQKIGVHAALENDVFRINGTIREEGKEYLVKRSFISGVNVINQNPDNRVSFKDMVKRLKRVISSKTGPVVR